MLQLHTVNGSSLISILAAYPCLSLTWILLYSAAQIVTPQLILARIPGIETGCRILEAAVILSIRCLRLPQMGICKRRKAHSVHRRALEGSGQMLADTAHVLDNNDAQSEQTDVRSLQAANELTKFANIFTEALANFRDGDQIQKLVLVATRLNQH